MGLLEKLQTQINRRDLLTKGLKVTGAAVGVHVLNKIPGFGGTQIAEAGINLLNPLTEPSSFLISPDRPLSKEDIAEELFNLISGAKKYTLNDGTWRIQYPGEEPSRIGWMRHAEAIGEYIGATGQTNKDGLDFDECFIRGTHEDLRRCNNPIDMISISLALRGLFAGKGILLPKLDEYRVDENGSLTQNGPLPMKQFWARRMSETVLSADFKGNHASFSLVAKTILSSLSRIDQGFKDVLSLSSWGGKDLQAIKDCYRDDGVFEDTAGGQDGHFDDIYTSVIQENIRYLSQYFQGDLYQARINWYSSDELRNISLPYAISKTGQINSDGVVIYDGRSASSWAANLPIIGSLINISWDVYLSNLVKKQKALFKKCFLITKQNAFKDGYVLPKLAEDATAFDSYNNTAVSTSNVAIALGRLLYDSPNDIWGMPEANPIPFRSNVWYEAAAGKLIATNSKGGILAVNIASYDKPKSNQAVDHRYLVRVKHPDFRILGSDGWVGDRPIINGALTVRYEGKGSMPYNLCYLNELKYSTVGYMDDWIGWGYCEGNFLEFADGLGRSGRETGIFLRQFYILSRDPKENLHVSILSRISPPDGVKIAGVNETSLPLPGNPKNNDFQTKDNSNGLVVISSKDRSIFGKMLTGFNQLPRDLYLFPGNGDEIQQNPFAPSNRAVCFSAVPNQREIVVGTEWVYKKGDIINPFDVKDFCSLKEASLQKGVLEIGGKIFTADFENRSFFRNSLF